MDALSCFTSLSLDSAVYATVATLAGFVLLVSWTLRQDHFFGRRHFLACLFGMIWWLGAASLELATPTLACKLAFASAAWPAITLVPICWCLFLAHYCFGLGARLRRTETLVVTGLVGLATLLVATNPWHGLFYLPGTRLGVLDGRPSAIFEHGPLFHALASLLYIFLSLAAAIAAAAAFRAPRAMRPAWMMMLFGTLVPLAANLAYVTLETTLFGFDPTPFAFAFVLLVFTWAIYANRSLDLTSQARDLIFFNLTDPVLVLDAGGRIVGMNPAAQALMPELAPGQSPSDTGPLARLRPLLEEKEGEGRWQRVEIGDRILEIRLMRMRKPLGGRQTLLGAVVLLTDVTDLHRNAMRLELALGLARNQLAEITRLREISERLARSDPLTGLGNRRALDLVFEAALPEHPSIGLALLDIDHFKQINDRFGHSAGDRVLRRFAEAVTEVLPEGTHAFRVGGEEFLILCPGFDMAAMAGLVGQVAHQVQQKPPLRVQDHSPLTFSAGIAVRPEDGRSLDQLYARADACLYEAKRSGRNRFIPSPERPALDGAGPLREGSRDPAGEDVLLARHLSDRQSRMAVLMRELMRATGPEVDGAIDRALAVMGAQCGADRAYVFRIEEGMYLSNTHEWCRDGIRPERPSLQRLPISLIEPWLPFLQQDATIDIPDVSALEERNPAKGHLVSQGIQALALAPLMDGPALAGFVGFDAVGRRAPFDPGETAILRSLADAVGAALARHGAETIAASAQGIARAAERDLARLAHVAEVMTNLVIILDTELRILWVNRAFETQTGHRLADVAGRDFASLVRGPQTDPAAVAAVQAAVERRESHGGETVNHDARGQPYWIHFNIHPMFDRDGTYLGYVSVETVISDRKALERELEARNALIAGVLRTSVSAILATDAAGRVLYANAAARNLLALTPAPDDPQAFRVPDWPLETLDGQPVGEAALPPALVRRSGEDQHDLRYAVRLPEGGRRFLSINAAPLPPAPHGAEIVMSVTDITDAEAVADRLRQLADEDPLTGLANRRALSAALEARLAAAAGPAPLALIMLDIDNFKSVNDTMRHEAGDRVLCIVAERLRACAGREDLLARLGGDEFMLLASGLDREAAVVLAERLRDAIARPIRIDTQPIRLTASAGVALCPDQGTVMPLLMTGADIALHAAKRAGRNRTILLSRELFAAEERRSAITRALDGPALDRLRLVYQPQFSLVGNGGLAGVEALLRWTDPVLGDVCPDEFIPLAEEVGLIVTIDDRVIAQAARQLRHWAACGWYPRLSINVSAQSLSRREFAQDTLQLLAAERIDPRQITLELTETSLLAPSSAEQNIASLRRSGIGLAIDDYGTGYASLSYLHRLRATEIKIDRSFIAGLTSENPRHSRTLIRAIIGLAGTLGMSTTAEGVETDAQREWLRQAGCDRIQGHLLSLPLARDELEARFLEARPLEDAHAPHPTPPSTPDR
ncbi:diguanylate cyclase (plasmid) [Cereibacter azotoformans]|uniref:diguanylate cyclase domain-containing protein n=1 Tax=Cereibacter azotoformans TaxID=43057 RepID=UPI001EE9C2A9|nr:diguanylate cyclase [Cereibacter azotoformans]ULB12208.1 diguanylate cyclase [Cereibacter azotoformans]